MNISQQQSDYADDCGPHNDILDGGGVRSRFPALSFAHLSLPHLTMPEASLSVTWYS